MSGCVCAGPSAEVEQPLAGPGAGERAGVQTTGQRQRRQTAAESQQIVGVSLRSPHREVQVQTGHLHFPLFVVAL